MTNMTHAEAREMMPVTQARAGAGAGCRTTWQKVRTSAFLVLAGAWLLACFGSANVGAQGMILDICPTDYGSFPENAPTLTCGCSTAAVKTGTVWGTNPYYYQSGLCRAALHAGAVGAEGGQVVVQPEKSTIFPAVSRNGVEARSSGPGMGFRVVVAGEPTAPKSPAPAGAASPGAPPQATGMTLDICPSNYDDIPEDAPTLTCGCTADGGQGGQRPWRQPLLLPVVDLPRRGACRCDRRRPAGRCWSTPWAPQPFFPAVIPQRRRGR